MLRKLLKFKFSYTAHNQSYVHGLSDKPLNYQTIGIKLREQANSYSDHPALISHHQNTTFSYSELYQESEKLAAALIKIGLKKGDRIGIYSPNNYEWVLTQYAASIADLILVNINPAYQLNELEYCLSKVGVRALITASQFKKSNYINMINTLVPELQNSKFKQLKSEKLPKLKYVIKIDDSPTQGMLNFKNLMEIPTNKDIQKIHQIMKLATPDDITNIQFTSGTTGSPKGASLTHFNILNNGLFIGDRLGINSQDKICLPVPLYHCFGMVLGNLCALNYGATIILTSEGFNPQKTLESITKYKCTALYGVPTMFYEYIREYEAYPNQYNIQSLCKGIMAGSLCPQVLMEKLKNQWNMKDLQICYGMTETSPVSFQTSKEDSLIDSCSTVGKILPHLEAKLINKKGKIIQRGEIGEICIRGYSVMEKYWADIKNTNKTIDEDGWIKTGDLGEMDERGYMKIVGRSKDMIIRGGENIYPKEIEEYIRTYPKVMDVQIVGIPNQKYGEETFCLIRLQPNVQFDKMEIYDYCKGNIAHYKIPKYVKVVEEFSLTVTGKPQKYIMSDQLKKEMDGNEENLIKYQIRDY